MTGAASRVTRILVSLLQHLPLSLSLSAVAAAAAAAPATPLPSSPLIQTSADPPPMIARRFLASIVSSVKPLERTFNSLATTHGAPLARIEAAALSCPLTVTDCSPGIPLFPGSQAAAAAARDKGCCRRPPAAGQRRQASAAAEQLGRRVAWRRLMIYKEQEQRQQQQSDRCLRGENVLIRETSRRPQSARGARVKDSRARNG